jgi:hypothetical protein
MSDPGDERNQEGDPPPASEDTPDGQFDDQDMPTTDGEPAERDPDAEPPD